MEAWRITEHLPVTTSGGEHPGSVAQIDGGLIVRAMNGSPVGNHHSIPRLTG
ncbi:MAG: hypothetical protein AVDCRST_MAG73-2968 [uncultured Thermomicrobiales bacterium]|uniref:Uncharacterized protein n=1 Tax=uncultured Thermomicrobiales bacterium TaxID=1645740 RepID=A0A6J4UIY0_9BACT|nr:MAG: hypothetical protein AVDCRST_MAG73-2968 [uncultured Thermomicrobiales bacterium]